MQNSFNDNVTIPLQEYNYYLTLAQENNEKKEQIKSLIDLLKEVQTALSNIKREMDEQKNINDEEKKHCHLLLQEKITLKSGIEKLTEDLTNVVNLLDEKKLKIVNLENALSQNEKEIKDLRDINDNYLKTCIEIKKENSELREEIETLKKKKIHARKRIFEFEFNRSDENIKEFENEASKIMGKIQKSLLNGNDEIEQVLNSKYERITGEEIETISYKTEEKK